MSDISLIMILTAIITSIFAVLMAVLYSVLRMRKDIQYNSFKNQAQIESIRNSYEKKLYEISDRLVSSESRWRDVNHLILSAQKYQSSQIKENKVILTGFLSERGIKEEDLEMEKDLVFVLTPFNNLYEKPYNAIKEVCHNSGLSCKRGDEQNVKSDILGHILKQMVKARLIIANIDGRNPNVLYELGIAHAIDKSTILVASSLEKLPADIKSIRMVVSDDIVEMKKQLSSEISKALVIT